MKATSARMVVRTADASLIGFPQGSSSKFAFRQSNRLGAAILSDRKRRQKGVGGQWRGPYRGNSVGYGRAIGGERMHHFTPLSGLIGGALIGLASALLMLSAGRLAGVSGILGGALNAGSDRAWRLAFIAGLIV